MVCVQLSTLDLFQCSQVCSAWYDVVMPYMWTTVPLLKNRQQQESLRRLVLIDYIQERQWKKQLREEEEENGFSGPSSLPPIQPTLLEEYGHLVNTIPKFDTFVQALNISSGERSKGFLRTSYSLLEQFFKRCPNIKVPELHLRSIDLLFRVQVNAIAKTIVPLAQTLLIGPEVARGQAMRLSVLRKILGATSSRLSILCLRLNYYRDDSAEYGDNHAWKSPGALFSNLTRLHLVTCGDYCYDNSAVSDFWVELWDHCRGIEVLLVNRVLPSIFDTLVRGVSAMRNLDRVFLGNGQVSHFDALYDDHQLAALISAGSKGWKQVQNDSTTQMGGFSMFALLQHFATLEELSIVQHIGGMGVITFLSACPKLCSFSVQESVPPPPLNDTLSDIDITHFIDWDPTTKLLNPWACETTLTVLRIWVDGIPLVDDEDYPGKRQHLIRATFERLARLVNLQELALGYAPLVPAGMDFGLEPARMEMTISSGLWRLEALKSMKILDLRRMDHGA
ncbi:hypothetical protein CPB97_004159 [Podila verticillata]|nr:hypothetical protein CPB97_004159 [Podila verticillata]